MPELPEVEVVRRGLRDWMMNSTVDHVQIHDQRSLRRHLKGPEHFTQELTGTLITNISRRGKYLWLSLNKNGHSYSLVMHLGMSGQLLIKTGDQQYAHQVQNPDASLLPQLKHLKVRLTCLTESGQTLELWFVDQRIFGGMHLDSFELTDDGAPAGWSEVPEKLLPATISHIARDPLDPHFSTERLFRTLRDTNTQLKRALLDQSIVSGVGNIYADESLFVAKLHYLRRTATMTRREVKNLMEATAKILQDSLAAGGTTFDALYVDVEGNPGYFARELHVYGKENLPCPRCTQEGRPRLIKREIFATRSSYFCPQCQPRPRNNPAKQIK